MANFSYKRTITTALKAVGIIDIDRMVIDVDGDEKKLSPSCPILMAAVLKSILRPKTKTSWKRRYRTEKAKERGVYPV